MEEKILLQLEGNVNDLLTVDNDHDIKSTRFIVDETNEPNTDEIVDITIMSKDPSRTHPIFNKQLMNKKVLITITEIV